MNDIDRLVSALIRNIVLTDSKTHEPILTLDSSATLACITIVLADRIGLSSDTIENLLEGL
jgi:hypothetical protein